jgi:hypothetical protein
MAAKRASTEQAGSKAGPDAEPKHDTRKRDTRKGDRHLPRKGDRHSPGYMKAYMRDYMRRRRAERKGKP